MISYYNYKKYLYEKVKFTQMKDGTKEDYLLLDKHEKEFIKKHLIEY